MNIHEKNNTNYWPLRQLVIVTCSHTLEDQAKCQPDFSLSFLPINFLFFVVVFLSFFLFLNTRYPLQATAL